MILKGNVGYIDLKKIFAQNFRISYEKVKKCKGIILDARTHPNGNYFEILRYFSIKENQFWNYIFPDIYHPGKFKLKNDTELLKNSTQDHFKGKVVILVDEFTQSHGEFTVCLLYTSPSPRDQRGSRMPSSA